MITPVSILEEDAGVADGGIIRHQRDLAQMRSAFIGFEQIIQDLLAEAGIVIHHIASFEGEMEVVHQLSAYGKRHGGTQRAVHPVRVGHAEDFLGWNVGEEAVACFAKT